MIVAPSILTVKEEERDKYLNELLNLGIRYLHLDIMDGKFVPNITEGVTLLEKINKFNFIFDTHLMVDNPSLYILDFVNAKSDIITFHLEATCDALEVINQIHSSGVKCGISIKPKTDISLLVPYLDKIDQVLVMSVEPGFGGQKFMEEVVDKIKQLSDLRLKNPNYQYLIEVDGGIKEMHTKMLASVGVDIIVMGTALTLSDNPKRIIDEVNSL